MDHSVRTRKTSQGEPSIDGRTEHKSFIVVGVISEQLDPP
jgi:hypothetical protein